MKFIEAWLHLKLITKTRLYNFDPIKPHLYIVELGFTGLYIIFHILLKRIDYGCSLEPPHRGGSNEYPQSLFWAGIWKKNQIFFYLKIVLFLGWKNLIYLNRRVFVMLNNEYPSDLRETDTLSSFSVIVVRGDNFYDFVFGFLHTMIHLKRSLLKLKGAEKIFSLKSKPLLIRRQQQFWWRNLLWKYILLLRDQTWYFMH